MRQDILIAVGAGLASVVLFASTLFGGLFGMMISYFALLPLMVLGLRNGPSAVQIATLAGSGATLFIAGVEAFMIYAVVVALPSMTAVRIALTEKATDPQGSAPRFLGIGDVVTALAVVGMVVVTATSFAMSSGGDGLQASLDNLVDRYVDAMLNNASAVMLPAELEQMQQFFDQVRPVLVFLPALAGASWVLMAVVNLLVAQGVIAKLNATRRPPLTITGVILPKWVPGLLGVAGIGAFLLDGEPGYVAVNVAAILGLPFVVQGLAVIHRFAAKYSAKVILLIVFYIVAMLSVWAPFLIAALGIVEHFLLSRPGAPEREA